MSTKEFLSKYHQPLFYSSWLLLHLIQAHNTELFDDEAYYWVYSRFPAWGYFDHPPMIAILIRAGYALFQNELGVRLLTVLLSTGALYVIELLISKKNALLFYAICGSLALAQIGGMLAVPDAPLMFFVAVFFYVYRLFLDKTNVVHSLLLGLTIALMFYTKYHAVLIVMFTILSNLRLLTNRYFYFACLFALLLFVPHLLWQYENGFPSVQFHLFERNAAEPKLWNTFEFFIGQLLLAGPLTGWLLIIAALLYKPTNLSERALKFSVIGVYVFFLLSTFRGRAEANWTIPCFIGLIVLSHQYLLTHGSLRKLLFRIVPVVLVLVLAGRIIMMVDLQPAWWIFKDEFHDNKIFVQKIKSRSKENSVVFLDTYQKPSKYWFYSGDTAFGLNTPTYRRNNYNFWMIEENYIGKPAFVFGAYDTVLFTDGFLLRTGEKSGGRFVADFYSFSKVRIEDVMPELNDANHASIMFTTITPEAYIPLFKQAPYDTAAIYLAYYNKEKVLGYIPTSMKVKDITTPIQQHRASIMLPDLRASLSYKLAISNCLPGRPSINSTRFGITAK